CPKDCREAPAAAARRRRRRRWPARPRTGKARAFAQTRSPGRTASLHRRRSFLAAPILVAPRAVKLARHALGLRFPLRLDAPGLAEAGTIGGRPGLRLGAPLGLAGEAQVDQF